MQNKYKLLSHSREYIGLKIGTVNIAVSYKTVQEVCNFIQPRTPTQVRSSFLGLCSIYRHFIPNFSALTYPLNTMLRWNHPAQLGPVAEEQVEDVLALREGFSMVLVLISPLKGHLFRWIQPRAAGNIGVHYGKPTWMVQAITWDFGTAQVTTRRKSTALPRKSALRWHE